MARAKLTHIFFSSLLLRPGGGERYLLTSALAFRRIGFSVDLILRSQTKCITILCVEAVLTALRIEMSTHEFKLRIITDYHKEIPFGEYDFFYVSIFSYGI